MKKLLLGTVALTALGVPAIAADMGVRPVYRPVVAYTNWTGCHIGGMVGIQSGRSDGYTTNGASTITFVGPTAATPPVVEPLAAGQPLRGGFNMQGFNGGGYGGCDYQVSNWVFGVEGDWSVVNNSGQSGPGVTFLTALPPPIFVNPSNYGKAEERWYATARGRLGYAVDKWLFFVTGGAAWTRIDSSLFVTGGPTPGLGGPTPVQFELQNDRRTGWTIGGGFDYAITNASLMPGWSVRVEYLYMDFRNFTTFTSPTTSGVITGLGTSFVTNLDTKLTNNVVRVGFAYKFGNYAGAYR